MWIGLAVVAAFQIYYVQEMIAAFVVLGAVFALISGAGFLVLAIDRASERGLCRRAQPSAHDSPCGKPLR